MAEGGKSDVLKHNLKCPECGRKALTMFKQGNSYCQACQHKTSPKPKETLMPKSEEAPKVSMVDFDKSYSELKRRRISRDTCVKYDYRVGHYCGNLAQIANYRAGEEIIAQHIRYATPDKSKNFAWTGSPQEVDMFGSHLGSTGLLVIFEGELDAMSGYEFINSCNPFKYIKGWGNFQLQWCCVSLPNGTSSAKSMRRHLPFIDQFEKVIYWGDNDEPGIKAAAEVQSIVGKKLSVVSGCKYNDANEAWVNQDHEEMQRCLLNAQMLRPKAIIPATALWDEVMQPSAVQGLPLAWDKWTEFTKGLKPGELWMISGGTSIGKSIFTRSMAVNLSQSGTNVAYVGLEETAATTMDRMLSQVLKAPFYLWDRDRRRQFEEENPGVIREAWQSFAGSMYLMDVFGSDSFESFVSNVRHYVLNEECRVVFVDHFSMLADGIALGQDQRRAIDKAIKDLKTLAVELQFTLVCVCHLSRDNSGRIPIEEGGEPSLQMLRGSHSLAQIPDFIVMLQRNPLSDDYSERNVTHCWLKKNRVTGQLGRMDRIAFDPNRYTLTELVEVNIG